MNDNDDHLHVHVELVDLMKAVCDLLLLDSVVYFD